MPKYDLAGREGGVGMPMGMMEGMVAALCGW